MFNPFHSSTVIPIHAKSTILGYSRTVSSNEASECSTDHLSHCVKLMEEGVLYTSTDISFTAVKIIKI